VRIRVGAAAVNVPDLLMIRGQYQDRPDLPFAPGAEVAGDVLEVADDVGGVEPGDRVYAWIGHGGFAEEVVAEAGTVIHVPEDMPDEIAATLPIAYGTAYHALVDRADLREGETLLVLGAAGGVGLAATQVGAAIGARVIAAVSSDEKEAAARDAGAVEVVRYDGTPLRDALREIAPGGVDVALDPVGGDATEAALRSMAYGGRLLIVGFASGDIPAIPANLPLLKCCVVVGVFWGRFARTEPDRNRRNFDTLGRWWLDGRIDPLVSRTYPLDAAVAALRRMDDRGAVGKLVILPRGR
jgi:NADPH2:quinone reductase